jgi:hypothetical protein
MHQVNQSLLVTLA